MGKLNGIETSGSLPDYTWGKSHGYHINGAKASVLEGRVIPEFDSLPRPALVADYGCGNGRFARKSVELGVRYAILGYEIQPGGVTDFNSEFANTPHRAEEANLVDLDLGVTGVARFDGALFWRVLHAIEPQNHADVLANIARTLKAGASLHVAVRSEKDWVAAELKERGLYSPGQTNECFPVMAQALTPGVTTWPLYFFREGELVGLGKQVGLRAVYQELMQEKSGFVGLQGKPDLSYDYVKFIKP